MHSCLLLHYLIFNTVHVVPLFLLIHTNFILLYFHPVNILTNKQFKALVILSIFWLQVILWMPVVCNFLHKRWNSFCTQIKSKQASFEAQIFAWSIIMFKISNFIKCNTNKIEKLLKLSLNMFGRIFLYEHVFYEKNISSDNSNFILSYLFQHSSFKLTRYFKKDILMFYKRLWAIEDFILLLVQNKKCLYR